jgi:peptidyl-prolyl cis-trans isomerase A (cyclophilin A)
MNRPENPLRRWLLFCGLCLAGSALAQQTAPPDAPATAPAALEAPPPAAPATVTVVMATTMGNIHIDLEKDKAPITVANFLRYVDAKRFDNITFYRAMKISEDGKYGLMQAGLKNSPKLLYKPIAHESTQTTGLSHLDGSISMARLDPGTATADFFFVLGDLKSLDAKADGSDPGYAVFGRVTEGLSLLRQMLDLPRSEDAGDGSMKGQMLSQPVKVLTVRRAN